MEHVFSLEPFSSTEESPKLKIAGNIVRYSNLLTITYAVLGDLKEISILALSEAPERKNELWRETCFEFFLGIQNSPRYWEFNLSPTGDWNVYSFDSYRQGMKEEVAFTLLPFSVQHQADSLTLALNIDLEQIIPTEQAIDIAITAVIKQQNDSISYWALAHKGTEADFHLRDSFIIGS
ncbi:MAG: DOMON-like domain-containing protein [Calothrix sp. SM1_7_51]|nr:DOMON-like domain-containing protein [Calothrix sp. SM1_7_51]